MSPPVTIRTIVLLAALSSPALAQNAATPTGTWDGTYSCIQGKTALHLAIRQDIGDTLTAVFSFSALPSNASVPKGSFEMAGTFDPSTNHLRLSPGAWLAHPRDFVSVGLDGKLACSGSHLVGKVTGGAFCTSFDLVRDGSAPGTPSCGPESARVASR